MQQKTVPTWGKQSRFSPPTMKQDTDSPAKRVFDRIVDVSLGIKSGIWIRGGGGIGGDCLFS